jgi:hypothetical protein
MAGSKSNYLESSVLNYWLGKSFSSTAPANVHVRLYNSTVNDSANAATDSLEGGTAANYADVQVTNSSASWTNSTSGGSKTNKITLTFTTAASTGWGTVQSFAILDANSTTTGNVLYWGDLTSSQAIAAGNIVRFSTGAIVISED